MDRAVTKCRVCEGEKLERYLDLGQMPLINNLPTSPEQQEKRYPLEVAICTGCSLSQLTVVIDPEDLFENYTYRSSISKTFGNHCAGIAKTAHEQFGMKENDLVIDIASNDGYALQQFTPYKIRPLGVDPAQNLASLANSLENKERIPTIPTFWTPAVADYILHEKGPAKIVTATNVLAHVDNIKQFIQGIDRVLAKDGTLIVEVPYLVDLLSNNVFDTVYHEHLSYFLATPLAECFAKNGLHINRIDRVDIHGGSIRVYAQKEKNPDKSIEELLTMEKAQGYLSPDKYFEFQKKADATRTELVSMVKGLTKLSKKRIAGFGASAKGSIMLNYCKLGPKDIEFVVDDTPEKQNKYMAGTKIPILSREALDERKPDYLLVLAWNFFKEVKEKTREFYNKGGSYILPTSPALRIVRE